MVSTLTVSAKVGKTSKKVVIFALPLVGKALEVDDIPVSEKFLNPDVCTKLLTGLFRLSHSIGLWIE